MHGPRIELRATVLAAVNDSDHIADPDNVEPPTYLLQLDGQHQSVLHHCRDLQICDVQAGLTVAEPGWHAAAIIIHRPSHRVRNVAGSVAFRVVLEDEGKAAQAHIPEPADLERLRSEAGQGPGRSCDRDRRFSVHAIGFDRPEHMRTLLASLAGAYYDQTSVALHVHLDSPKAPASPDQLARVQAVRDLVSSYRGWVHGDYAVHVRVRNGGVTAQRLESWFPTCGEDVAAWFEDDLEVSPLWFRWVRAALLERDRHVNETGVRGESWRRMNGLCLQRNWLVPSKYLKQLTVRNGGVPFFYRVIGPLGTVALGHWWRDFVQWYAER